MKKLIGTLLIAFSAIFTLTGCNKESSGDPGKEDPKEDQVFVVVATPSPASFTYSGGTLAVMVRTNVKYEIAVSADWITKETTKAVETNSMKFSIAPNTDKTAREGKITFTPASGDKQVVTVSQTGRTLPNTIRLLAIGNSFSADAVEQELYGLFAGVNQKIIIGNMYIGGCPLSEHAANAKADAAAYSYRKIVDGVMKTTSSVKLSTALKDEPWDFISVQEGAGYHGFYNTTYSGTTHSMEPDLTNLIKYCQENSANKDFELVYHAPWVAKKTYTGKKFSYYGFNTDVMYKMICEATQQVLAAHPEVKLLMNSMDAVQNGRSSYIGDNFDRDGWHMSYSLGRYVVGCLWFERIMGESVVGNPYHPASITDYEALVCQTAAHEAVLNPYKITDLSTRFKKPEGGDTTKKTKVLAKWYFSPDRAKSDGYVQTWAGQSELGVYNYSNEPGERGYINANEEGKGKLSYVQIDKTKWTGDNAGLMVFNVSNGGQPVVCGAMPGDYWLLETTGGNELPEGTKIHAIFTYTPVKYGCKYWMLEYSDGSAWKPAFEVKTTTIAASGETIQYNKVCTANQVEPVEFTVTLENPTTEFKVRMTCCSQYQVNDKWFGTPNASSVQRIAGDPNNPEKPLPQIEMVL